MNTLRKNLKSFGIVLILLVEMIIFSIASPSFLTGSNIRTVLIQVTVVAICSLGMMFVLITGGIDLSVGYMISAVGMVAAVLMADTGMNPVAAALLAMCFAMIFGLIQGCLIAFLKVPPFIVTMAFMNVLQGFSYLITSGQSVYGIPDSFKAIGQGSIGPVPICVIIMLAAMVIAGFILKKTYFGRYFYALGGNETATRLAGVNVRKYKILTYVICSAFTGLAGLVMLSRMATGSPNAGDGYEFDVITACVVGGVSMSGGYGHVYQTFVGALIIQILNNGLILLHVNTYIQLILKGLILLLAVSVDYISRNRAESSRRKKAISGKAA